MADTQHDFLFTHEHLHARSVASTSSRTSTSLQITSMGFLVTRAQRTPRVTLFQQTTRPVTEGTTYLQTYCLAHVTTTSMTSPRRHPRDLYGKHACALLQNQTLMPPTAFSIFRLCTCLQLLWQSTEIVILPLMISGEP